MKKCIYILIIGFSFLFIAPHVSAQDTSAEKDFKFTIKTNPLAALGGPFWVLIVPITGEYKVLFEAKISDKSSLQLGAGYLGPSLLINLDDLSSEPGEINAIKTSGFRGQLMYKQFLSRDLSAPEGFYLGPHLSYATATIKNKDNPDDNIGATKLNINAVIGYQMITSGGFTLDVFTGMGFVSKKWDISGSTFDVEEFSNKNTVNIPFGLSFGYAF